MQFRFRCYRNPEIAARRALGDPRPIREADIWANMARNLARKPEKTSALEFLERARDLRRGTVRAMQAGLQRIEQRQTEGQGPALAQSFEQQRENEQSTAVHEPMRMEVRRQGKSLRRVRDVVPAVLRTVTQVLETARPLLRQAVEQIREQRELDAMRGQLFEHQMAEKEQSAPSGTGRSDFQQAQKTLQTEIAAFKPDELRAQVREAKQEALKRKESQRAVRHTSRPSPGT